MADCAKNFSL
uniref:Uncharacterized protein n=1 Tax=Anguilla anguilla TaxID=7936 RepID=A0A0E9VK55_ANGAN